MSTNPSNPVSEFLQFANDYQYNPNQNSILEPLKEQVLLLRAKYATYDTITENLNKNGVKVSEATVRRFCRMHRTEIERLRNEIHKKASEVHRPSNDPLPSTGSFEEPSGGEIKHPILTTTIDRTEPRNARDQEQEGLVIVKVIISVSES